MCRSTCCCPCLPVADRFLAPLPAALQAPASRQLTHCVFLSYKTLAHTTPACRMWLDGARAVRRRRRAVPACAQAGLLRPATARHRLPAVLMPALFPIPHPLQREVYNPKAEARLQYGGGGPRVAQAGITLHRKHEMPSGVYTTGAAGPRVLASLCLFRHRSGCPAPLPPP